MSRGAQKSWISDDPRGTSKLEGYSKLSIGVFQSLQYLKNDNYCILECAQESKIFKVYDIRRLLLISN